jgi:hypothetical protein
VEFALALHLLVALGTNGTLIDRSLAERLAELPIKIQLSLDGASAEVHDGIRRPCSYDLTRRVAEAEIDEMWSFVGKKKEQRWLWHAVDHRSGKVLAYVLGTCKNDVFLLLKMLLEPFVIQRFYTDGGGAHVRHLAPETHNPGKL